MNRVFLPHVTVLMLAMVAIAFAEDPPYLEIQQTFTPVDHRWPMINNKGEYVYCQQVGGLWQVFSNTRGQLTFPNSEYTDATSPAIADDGRFICFRHDGRGLGFVLKYPGPAVMEVSTTQTGT